MNKPIDKAFKLWLNEGLLDDTQVAALRASLEREQEGKSSPAVTIIATFGSVLVGVGILLFVASNWSGMGAVARVLAVFAAYLLSVLFASITDRRGLPRVANSLWLLTTISIGAYMFLLGQLFNYSLTYWQAPFLWMIAALTMGYARNSKAHGMLAVPLALLTLGWFGGGSGWFMDDQLEFLVSSGGLRPIFPFIGIGLIAASLLAERAHNESLHFLLTACRFWGGMVIATPLILLSIENSLVEYLAIIYWSTKQILIVGFVFALIAAVFASGQRHASYIMLGFSTVMLILLIPGSDGANLLQTLEYSSVLYACMIFVLFATAVATAAFGARLNSRMMINFGVASAAILIFIQYFSWSFVLLERSLAFIVGGILLIVTAIFLERQRRSLIARITDSAEAA
jgi:uncharacterized membrane protein